MTVNAELILNTLKQNYGKEFSKQELVQKLGVSMPTVTATIRALTNKGYVIGTREETVELEPATETRKAKTRVIKYHTLTEAGLAYDPVAEAAEKEAAKEAAKAARAAERAAAKAAKENA